MNIVCFGDSITHAADFAEADRWPTILQRKLDERKLGAFKVYNRGIGGHTTAQGLDRFFTDVMPLLPAVVLIEFGFNDGNVADWSKKPRVGLDEFKANLREMHRAIRSRKGTPVFIVNHTIGPSSWKGGNGKSYNANFAPYNPAIKQVAVALKAPTIDLPAMMRRRRVDLNEFLSEHEDDNLHLSARGNHLYADMVFETLTLLLK
jgi:lysophospholipase L1-like esterase